MSSPALGHAAAPPAPPPTPHGPPTAAHSHLTGAASTGGGRVHLARRRVAASTPLGSSVRGGQAGRVCVSPAGRGPGLTGQGAGGEGRAASPTHRQDRTRCWRLAAAGAGRAACGGGSRRFWVVAVLTGGANGCRPTWPMGSKVLRDGMGERGTWGGGAARRAQGSACRQKWRVITTQPRREPPPDPGPHRAFAPFCFLFFPPNCVVVFHPNQHRLAHHHRPAPHRSPPAPPPPPGTRSAGEESSGDSRT